jgi:hypothetical protein
MAEFKDNQAYLKHLSTELKKALPFRWRAQNFFQNFTKCSCVAYVDARDVMNLLDEVCVFGWERKHSDHKGRVFCSIGIHMPDGTIHWRSDCGEESRTAKEKGEASDSFKRAAVNWGVGRFLYDKPIHYLPARGVERNGKTVGEPTKVGGGKIHNLNDYINENGGMTEQEIDEINERERQKQAEKKPPASDKKPASEKPMSAKAQMWVASGESKEEVARYAKSYGKEPGQLTDAEMLEIAKLMNQNKGKT